MKLLKVASIAFVLSCFLISLNGQTERGKVLLGGGTKLSFTSMSTKWKSDNDSGDEGSSTELEFSPQIGYFVSDGLALGLDLPITYSSQKDEEDDKYSSTSIAFAPFARYYFGKGNIKPYLHGELGYGNVNMKITPASGSSNDVSAGMFLYEIGGGFGIFLNEKLSIDIGLGYSSVSVKPKKDNDENYRSISSGLGLRIGIVILL